MPVVGGDVAGEVETTGKNITAKIKDKITEEINE